MYRGSRKPFPIKRKGDVLTRAFFNVIFTNRYAIMEAKPHKSKCTDTLLLYAKFWARNSPTWHYTSMFPKPLFFLQHVLLMRMLLGKSQRGSEGAFRKGYSQIFR